jgi:hypothetical protein
MNLSDSTVTILASAIIVGVPSLIAALAGLSNRRHLRTGNGQNLGEYAPMIYDRLEQNRAALKEDIAAARHDWIAALAEHTASDQANFEELRALVTPPDPTP